MANTIKTPLSSVARPIGWTDATIKGRKRDVPYIWKTKKPIHAYKKVVPLYGFNDAVAELIIPVGATIVVEVDPWGVAADKFRTNAVVCTKIKVIGTGTKIDEATSHFRQTGLRRLAYKVAPKQVIEDVMDGVDIDILLDKNFGDPRNIIKPFGKKLSLKNSQCEAGIHFYLTRHKAVNHV